MERELEMKENDRNFGNINADSSIKKKSKKGTGVKNKRKQWDQTPSLQISQPVKFMQYDQPDKWITINELLAKGNFQLIDLQGSGPVEASVIAVLYTLIREVQILTNKLNHSDIPEMAKLEKELENSRQLVLKHEQTIFVSHYCIKLIWLET